MPTQIRTATIADVPSIHELGHGTSEFAVNQGETIDFWPVEILQSAVNSADVLILVAEKDEELLGFVVAALNRGLRKALIENIYVSVENRGQGIGDQLLQMVIAMTQDEGCEYIATLVTAHTPAVDLYARNGFDRGGQFLWLDKSLTDTFRAQPGK